MTQNTSQSNPGIIGPTYRPDGDALRGVDRYVAIEEIRLTKARYCAAMDDHDFAALRRVFTDDCILDWPCPGVKIETIDDFVAFLAEVMPAAGPVRSRHFAHNLQVEFTSPSEALVRWDHHNWAWFEDNRQPTMEQWGQYRERYRKSGSGWLISYFSEQFLFNSPAPKRRAAGIADGGVENDE